MVRRAFGLCLFVAAAALAPACSARGFIDTGLGSDAAGDDGDADTYVTYGQAFIAANCGPACHSVATIYGDLTVYTNVMDMRELMIQVVEADVMPQGGALPAAEKQRFLDWLNAGAPQGSTDTYASYGRAFIAANCGPACHSAATPYGDLTTYDQVTLLRLTMLREVQAGNMPQGRTLPPDEKQRLLDWLNAGAPP
jgi:hypothetical protein